MNPITAAKWIAGVLIALMLFFGGRSCGVNSGAKALASCESARNGAVVAAQTMADALEASTKEAERGAADAAKHQAQADKAVEEALKDKAAYERRLAQIEKDMAKGMASKDCREQMERPVCVPLH